MLGASSSVNGVYNLRLARYEAVQKIGVFIVYILHVLRTKEALFLFVYCHANYV